MKAIVTVIGKDKTGIIYNVSKVMMELGINIEDISQTIMQEYFTMLMLVEYDEKKVSFKEMKERLDAIAEDVGLSIQVQKEAIFDAMHNI